jgi:hypothetical protein
MDPTILIALVVLILAVIGAGLSWRSVTSYLCIVIAIIELIVLLPGGPF